MAVWNDRRTPPDQLTDTSTGKPARPAPMSQQDMERMGRRVGANAGAQPGGSRGKLDRLDTRRTAPAPVHPSDDMRRQEENRLASKGRGFVTPLGGSPQPVAQPNRVRRAVRRMSTSVRRPL